MHTYACKCIWIKQSHTLTVVCKHLEKGALRYSVLCMRGGIYSANNLMSYVKWASKVEKPLLARICKVNHRASQRYTRTDTLGQGSHPQYKWKQRSLCTAAHTRLFLGVFCFRQNSLFFSYSGCVQLEFNLTKFSFGCYLWFHQSCLPLSLNYPQALCYLRRLTYRRVSYNNKNTCGIINFPELLVLKPLGSMLQVKHFAPRQDRSVLYSMALWDRTPSPPPQH